MRILWGSTAHPTPCLLIAFVWLHSAMWGTAHRLGHHIPPPSAPNHGGERQTTGSRPFLTWHQRSHAVFRLCVPL